MSNDALKVGNTHEPIEGETDYWTAGIHVGNHMHRIEVYGKTQKDAECLRDKIIEALRASAPADVVPVEPTQKMLSAGVDELLWRNGTKAHPHVMELVYKAMIAAAKETGK